MKKCLFLTILWFSCSVVSAQSTPKEWSKHFKEVSGTQEYAGVDAVPLDKNGNVVFFLEIPTPNSKKEETSQKAKLILENFLKKYVDEYLLEDKLTDDGELWTEVTAHTNFSTKSMGFIFHIKIKFEIGVYSSNDELFVLLSEFYSSFTTESNGVGGGREDDFKKVAIAYGVNKNNTKVTNNIVGWQRVGIIDLKKDIFKIFEEKMKLQMSELKVKEQW